MLEILDIKLGGLLILSLFQSQVSPEQIGIISLYVGILSLVVGIVAAIYAFISASRSERLLRRLIVYPFRELDKQMSQLPVANRKDLFFLFGISKGRKAFTLKEIRDLLGQFGEEAVSLLVEEGWMNREIGQYTVYRINPERRPYLTFLIESGEYGME